jgi:N-acetylmuramoyl-L-alanine amidase
MSGRFLIELADVCRAAGLNVIEVDGWQTRARSSGGYADGRPWCVMWHHTASQTSAANDVAYICTGSPDAPLANLYLARNGDVHVCAAGATNTNGKGGPLTVSRGTVPADQMNTYALGIEAGNNGIGEAWPVEQIGAYFLLNNALAHAYGLAVTDCATHAAWAPSRKVDPATAAAVAGDWRPRAINSSGTWDLDDVRAECVARDTPAPEPEPPEVDDVKWSQLTIIEAGAVFMGWFDGRWMPQVEWVNGDDGAQLARYNDYVRGGMGTITLSYTDLGGVTLLGPVPGRDDKFAQHGLHWSADMFGNVIG